MWDPAIYQRYADERSRPFTDLLARVGAEDPREVVDLGCGPGDQTTTLAARWPRARVTGLDSSPEMIGKARATGGPVEFAVADVREWRPGPRTDVVVANALFQWVPGHQELFRSWVAELPAGSWLAVQVPGNFAAPSHRALRDVATRARWRDRVGLRLRTDPVSDPAGYAEPLVAAGCAVDAWETTYLHLLPTTGAEHPVLTWMEGTALRPVRAVLGDGPDWLDFRAELAAELAGAYPARSGVVPFPFRRIFFVARTGTVPTSSERPAGPSPIPSEENP